MKSIYVNYGCGLSAPVEWINFDASLPLRLQKTPIFGRILTQKFKTFPNNVHYGDIIKGLPIKNDSCDGIYCSHTLEHLSLQDLRISLLNTHKILKKKGIFRCVVPDLEYYAREYIKSIDNGDSLASIKFIGENTLLGVVKNEKGLMGFLRSFYGFAQHLYMWDNRSLSEELKNAGFCLIRPCKFNDCEDSMFRYVEEKDRFINSVALECRK